MAKIICNIGDTLKCLDDGFNFTQHSDWESGVSKVTRRGDEFEIQEISEDWIKSTDGRIIYNRDNKYQVIKTNSNYEIY